jgi:hypothetical protein
MSYLKRRIVTTLPTTLRDGEEVYYQDPNGNRTLWVGNAQGEAWPACGYKEYVALLTQADTNAPVATVLKNTVGTVTYAYDDVGFFLGHFPAGSIIKPMGDAKRYFIGSSGTKGFVVVNGGTTNIEIITQNESEEGVNGLFSAGSDFLLSVIITPS